VAASGSLVPVRLGNRMWPHDIKMDGRPRSKNTPSISDLLHAIRFRSNGQEGKRERAHLRLGFRRPAARLRPRWSTAMALRWFPEMMDSSTA
jgi:hypothetical protein